MRRSFPPILFAVGLAGCAVVPAELPPPSVPPPTALELVDPARQRRIPVTLYGASRRARPRYCWRRSIRRCCALFSLDNRRVPWPRVAQPRLCSVRSSDFPADPGVLPTADEALRHDDMRDVATPAQQAAMLAGLDACLSR